MKSFTAYEIHGLTESQLAGKPRFGPFEVSFMNYELSLLSGNRRRRPGDSCTVTDSLVVARHKYPGQSNSLDALCRRYGIDNSAREAHAALVNADILARVYLAMTGRER